MDDDTIEEFFSDEPIDTVPDNPALDPDDADRTVVTSAAPPEHDDSPWPDRVHLIRGGVYVASGSTRIA